MKLFFFIVLFVTVRLVSAQELTIIDSKTEFPLVGVIISSGQSAVQTNEEGRVNLDVFSDHDILLFMHPSYESIRLEKHRVAGRQFQVRMIEKPLRLDEIVVSVSRRTEKRAEVPHAIIPIGQEQLMLLQPQTTAGLAATGGEVFIQESQQGGGSPMVRGFSANRLLLVVDGVRMNNAIFRSGNLHNVVLVDPHMIEYAEILLGPGSVIYGSDAMGGVLSFTTFRPRLSTGTHWHTEHSFSARHSTSNQARILHARMGFGRQKWGALFSATYADFGNLKMGRRGPDDYLRTEYVVPKVYNGTDSIAGNPNQRTQLFTDYHQLNLMGKLRMAPIPGFEMNFSVHYSETGDVPRYDRLIVYRNNRLRYGDWYYGPQKWLMLSGQTEWQASILLFDRLSLISGWQNFTESRNDRNLHSPWLYQREESVGVYNFTLNFFKEPAPDYQLMYGAEFLYNRIHSTGHALNLLSGAQTSAGTRYPDGSEYVSGALYLSGKTTALDNLVFSSGIRWTRTHMNGTFDNHIYHFPFTNFSTDNHALNGNLGMVWSPIADWKFNLIASSGFRSPNMDDVAKVFDSEPGNVIVPNPDLKPEYAYNLEGRLIRNFGAEGKIELSVFRTWLTDAMVRRAFPLNGQDSIMYNGVLSKSEALMNADGADIYGFSVQMEQQVFPGTRLFSGLTWMNGADSDGNPLRHVPPFFGTVRLVRAIGKFTTEVYSRVNGKVSNARLAPEEREKPFLYLPDDNGNPYSPAWWTLNVATLWNVSDSFSLSMTLDNIMNKRYRSYSSGIVAPGRNLSFTASVSL